MSDPYIPPRPGTPGTVAPGLAGPQVGASPGLPRGEYTRTNVNVGSPAVKSGNGFATGLMVALVFVVVAILAYSFLGSREDDPAGLESTPSVSIENNAAPAADAVVPDAIAPDATAPEAVAPDAATPDAATPDPAVPAPDTTAPAAPANP